MIAADDNSARRHAGCREQRLNFPERIRGRPRVRRGDRQIGADRAGSFAKPGLRQTKQASNGLPGLAQLPSGSLFRSRDFVKIRPS